MLSDRQIERYSRHIILPQIGGRGQKLLLSASVAVVGVDEPGDTAALYLVAAGVGRVTLVDPGPHDRSADAAARIANLNPDCRIEPRSGRVTVERAAELARDHTVVLDCSGGESNTSSLLNTACLAQRTPLVWGYTAAGIGYVTACAGQGSTTPCLDCITLPLPASATGTSAAGQDLAAGFIGSVQATEAIKLVLDLDAVLTGRLLICDLLPAVVREVPVAKNPRCVSCGTGRAVDTVAI